MTLLLQVLLTNESRIPQHEPETRQHARALEISHNSLLMDTNFEWDGIEDPLPCKLFLNIKHTSKFILGYKKKCDKHDARFRWAQDRNEAYRMIRSMLAQQGIYIFLNTYFSPLSSLEEFREIGHQITRDHPFQTLTKGAFKQHINRPNIVSYIHRNVV